MLFFTYIVTVAWQSGNFKFKLCEWLQGSKSFLESKKFPFLKCVLFQFFPGNFLKSVRVVVCTSVLGIYNFGHYSKASLHFRFLFPLLSDYRIPQSLCSSGRPFLRTGDTVHNLQNFTDFLKNNGFLPSFNEMNIQPRPCFSRAPEHRLSVCSTNQNAQLDSAVL